MEENNLKRFVVEKYEEYNETESLFYSGHCLEYRIRSIVVKTHPYHHPGQLCMVYDGFYASKGDLIKLRDDLIEMDL